MTTSFFQTVRIDGCAVCCRRLPPAPAGAYHPGLPVLLLHGLGCSGDAWATVLALFEKNGCAESVLAPDLPGYGKSECASGALSMDELADWTSRFLDNVGLARVHVAGHSMGCQVALALARRHPARVGGLALVGPTTGRRLVPLWRYGVGLLADGFYESARYNKTLAKMYVEMGMVRYWETVQQMMRDDPLGQAGHTAAPCLVLRGQRDKVIPLRAARRLAESVPQGQFAAIPGVAHAAQFDAPDAFLSLALPFWQAAADATRSEAAPSATSAS